MMVIAEKSVCAEKKLFKVQWFSHNYSTEAIACQKQSLNLIISNAKSFSASFP
jgi:hypothetical protein